MANYTKSFTKKKSKPLTQTENSEDFNIGLLSKYQFCEKEYRPNEC